MIITDKELYKIVLITTIIGVIGLIISSGYIETKNLEINQITTNNIFLRMHTIFKFNCTDCFLNL